MRFPPTQPSLLLASDAALVCSEGMKGDDVMRDRLGGREAAAAGQSNHYRLCGEQGSGDVCTALSYGAVS